MDHDGYSFQNDAERKDEHDDAKYDGHEGHLTLVVSN
jgi:hypothetical protein